MFVEKHIAFRQSLALLLSRELDLEVVAQAGSLAEARELLDSRLDMAVLDLLLPDGDGRELIGELRRANEGISVLMLSVTIRPEHLEEVLKAGADAVLHKVASPDHRRGGKAPWGRRMSHHDDRWWWVPRASNHGRASENDPSNHSDE